MKKNLNQIYPLIQFSETSFFKQRKKKLKNYEYINHFESAVSAPQSGAQMG